jgi:hypothetical protein
MHAAVWGDHSSAALISPNVEDYLTDDVARRLQGKSVAAKGATVSEVSEKEAGL